MSERQTVHVDAELKKRIKLYAISNDLKPIEVIDQAFSEFLDRNESKAEGQGG